MPIVLVHGVPETTAVWSPLVHELANRDHTDVICLSPPGFGAELPESFRATVDGYRDWLIEELEKIGSPVDLIGHDWGGGHVVATAISRPDLLRSWVTDVIGVYEPDYEWHPLAKIWQTPGEGERQIARMFGGSVLERAERMTEMGMPEPAASEVAGGQNEAMGSAIIQLYRSAAQPKMAQAGSLLSAAAARPGMAIVASEDRVVGSEAQRTRGASRAGARIEVLEGLGHWWMVQDPARGAEVISSFVRSIRNV